jgi:hypothetical protein
MWSTMALPLETPPARVEENHPVYTFLLHVAVWMTWPLMALAVAFGAAGLSASGWLAMLPLLLLLGLLTSDFVSGLFHWFFDNYGSPQTPVFGPTIELFRVHHDLPEDICNSNLVFTVGHVCIWVVPLALLQMGLWYLLGRSFVVSALLIYAASASLFLVLTNLFHKWAHLPVKPGWITWLQTQRLILESAHHTVHHTPPYQSYYCITTGWLNPLLFRVGFFPALERLLARWGMDKAV